MAPYIKSKAYKQKIKRAAECRLPANQQDLIKFDVDKETTRSISKGKLHLSISVELSIIYLF